MFRRAAWHVQTLFKVNDSEPRKRSWTSRKSIILGLTKRARFNSGELLTVNNSFRARFPQNPKHQDEYVYTVRKPRKGNNTKATQRQQQKSQRPQNYNFPRNAPHNKIVDDSAQQSCERKSWKFIMLRNRSGSVCLQTPKNKETKTSSQGNSKAQKMSLRPKTTFLDTYLQKRH